MKTSPRLLQLFRSIHLLLLSIGAFLLCIGSASAQLNPQEQSLSNTLVNSSGQERAFLKLDATLSKVARERAMDMARRDYFAHVNPDGVAANYLVTKAGYQLPPHYPTSGGACNIESIAAGRDSTSGTWSDWMGSPPHKTHLLGTDAFFATQTSYGVGYYYDAGSKYKHYWVVLSAPPEPGAELEIIAPAPGVNVTTAQVTISGTTGGGTPASVVQYRLENSSGTTPFRNASGVSRWSAIASGLAPGPNTVRIRSLNGSGAVLKEATRTVNYVLIRPLTVSINGPGTVTAGFLGTTSRVVGRTYTLQATAQAGWLFAGWSGSKTASSRSLTFTMAEGLNLVANFVVNPFFGANGAYAGVIHTDSWDHATSGILRVQLTETGLLTGRLVVGGVAYPIKTRFQLNGATVVTIPQANGRTLNVTLQFSGGRITGSVTDGSFTAAVAAESAADTEAAARFAGRYTVSLPASDSAVAAGAPNGHGFATLRVNSRGVGTLAGSLADGRRFTVTVPVSADGTFPVYAPLYGRKGSIAGHVVFRDTEASHCDGRLRWTKPELATSRVHPQPFACDLPVVGSRYVAPADGAPVVPVTTAENNAELVLAAGNLDPAIIQPATLSTGNRVTVSQPVIRGVTVTINPLNGIFSGRFLHPSTGVVSGFRGVILQKQNAGFGYFLGVNQSGTASLSPAL